MENIKLILLDLDYTLLRSDKTISPFTLQTLKECKNKDIMIGFSTSRGITAIKKYVNQVNPDIIICSGGACIYHKNELIQTNCFSIQQSQKLFNKTYEVLGPQAEITCDTIDSLYWNRTTDKSDNYSPDSLYDNFKSFKNQSLKICIQTQDSSKAQQIASVLPQTDIDYLPFSDIPWYKFSPSNATKENAIDYILKYLNIKIEETIAFGDDFSDIGMLNKCGKGIAMANAIQEVKNIVDEITDSCDDDGVAQWIIRKELI